MAHINLLPWRTELRKEREARFVSSMGIALALCGVIFFGVYTFINTLMDNQGGRNTFLELKIKEAKDKIKEIETLESKRESLYTRMKVIQKLQTSRPEIVHLFNEIARTLPNGVFYKKLVQKKNSITLDGVAQSDARVASLMRNLDKSIWLDKIDLKIIKVDKTTKERRKNKSFNLSISQKTPKKEGDEQEGEEE